MTYFFLALAIVFEVAWAISMKLSSGFTRASFAIATIVAYLLSVVFLAFATKKLDIGVAYAIWAGAGVAIIALIGMTYFKEPVNALKLASLALIVAGIIGLQLSGAAHAPLPVVPSSDP